MRNIKDELRHIILGDEPAGQADQIKKIQIFLRRNAGTGRLSQKQQRLKSEEAAELLKFAHQNGLLYDQEISENNFIAAGAEQRVYRFDDAYVIKTNGAIFYEYWLDYFNSLLIHNYFFPETAYAFLAFKLIDDKLHAIVKQEFIAATESTNLSAVKQFLEYNQFLNNRNNDYINEALGIIFEDLHDENVLSNNGILHFIDTIFYLTDNFYSS